MDQWQQWSLGRAVIFLTSLGFIMVGIQVGLLHYRGNFRHPIMWGPVVASPLIALVGLSYLFINRPWLRAVLLVALALEGVAGLIGFLYHTRGVGLRVGGYEMRNFLTGPPVIMPLMSTALSILGLMDLLL